MRDSDDGQPPAQDRGRCSTWMPPPPDRYTTVKGQRIRYWEEGHGPPLLLVHGLGTAVEAWQAVIGPFSAQFRVLAPDLPGFGMSSQPQEGFTLEAGLRFLVEFLDERGATAVAVAGTSMGGLLATRLALEHPHRVRRLVMGNAAGLGRELGMMLRLLSIPCLGEIITYPTHTTLRRAFGSLFCDRRHLPDHLISAIYRQRCQPGRIAALLRVARYGIDLWGQRPHVLLEGRLGQIRQPTLVIWGREDRLIPVAHAYLAARSIPDSRLHIIERCGHMPMLEQPEEYVRAVHSFLTAESDERERPKVG